MNARVILLLAASLLGGCKLMTKKEQPAVQPTATESSQPRYWGEIGNDSVFAYTLKNSRGMEATILNYGGTLARLLVPDRTGQPGDVVLGFDSLSGYLQPGNPYFGALIGRYSNRIGGARFKLDGVTYQLAANDHGNSLHGGLKGFDKVIWTVEAHTDSSLQLAYQSRDGEEGYPGNLLVKVIYTVTADNGLRIDYAATTDKPTPVNLTNHAYFNLSAGSDSTILGEKLVLHADQYTEVNDRLIPTGRLPAVDHTPMDFRVAKPIGQDIGQVPGGYDHNWVLHPAGDSLRLAAEVYDSLSGRQMKVFTTQPGIQFYTGNFLDGSLRGKQGRRYIQHSALCLETQHFPDSPNQPGFPGTILRPGETYHQTTVYQFSAK
ncbi:MAG TPA: aldose epimerase family protein [Chitinophagaceae bacterium]|nr:aldose epimerase family protein [Chitinophagaceae bacterium]